MSRLAAIILLAALALVFGCSDGPIGPPSDARTDTLIVGELGPYWPSKTRGDCEYNGHGPNVTLRAELRIRADSLFCYVYMRAAETTPDWSTAEGEWEEFLYTPPMGWRIAEINHPVNCDAQYTDTGHGYDITGCDGFVFRSIGDGSGLDICDRAFDDTHVSVRLDTLYVERRHR